MFSPRKDTADGRKYSCKECTNAKNILSKSRNNARSKAHYEANKVRYLAAFKAKWKAKRLANADEIRRKREAFDKYRADRRATAKDRKKLCQRIRRAKLMLTDRIFALRFRIRNRIQMAIKQRCCRKAAKTVELLGCSVKEAMQHLEKQFKDGMTWENHGPHWHIDHIIPLRAFDISTIEGQKKAFHFSNLQPLLAKENLKKNDMMPNGVRARRLK